MLVTRASNCPACLAGEPGRHPDTGGTHPLVYVRGTGTFRPSGYTKPDGTTTTILEDPDLNIRIDITGGVLKQYPSAVVERRQFDGGINYEVKVPGRTYKVRHSVEWGDSESEALAYILDRLAGPDTWNGR